MVREREIKRGDSFGILMPKEVLDVGNIKEGREIVEKEKEREKAEAIFGIWKGLPSFTHTSEDHEL